MRENGEHHKNSSKKSRTYVLEILIYEILLLIVIKMHKRLLGKILT